MSTYADLLVASLFVAWLTDTPVRAVDVDAFTVGTHALFLTLINLCKQTIVKCTYMYSDVMITFYV